MDGKTKYACLVAVVIIISIKESGCVEDRSSAAGVTRAGQILTALLK